MHNRSIFVGRHRLGDLCVQLQNHKMFLDNFDQTYVISQLPTSWFIPLLEQYNINTKQLIFINDNEIYNRYPNSKQFATMHTQMGGWLQQQILKMAVLDLFDYSSMTIQDPDTFWINPWSRFSNGQPVMLVWPNHNESQEYYDLLTNLTGIPRQTPHCLVTEFMTVTKQDWTSFKSTVESHTGTNWIAAIAKNLSADANGKLWMSEYELLGNWIIHTRNPVLVDQKRFEFTTLEELQNALLTNTIHAVSNQSDELLWAEETQGIWAVNNFEKWQSMFPAYKGN